MKIAVLADIHSNLIAFNLALKDLKQESPDKIIFLGDYITDGPYGNEVVNIVKEVGDYIIYGNRERYMFDYDPSREIFINYGNIAFQRKNLSNETYAYLKSLEEYKIVKINGVKFLLIHGDKYFKACMEDKNKSFDKLISEYDFDVCLFAHTHIFWDEVYKGKRFINPGSLGLPSDGPSYKYVIIEVEHEISVNLKEICTKDSFLDLKNNVKKSKYHKTTEEWSNMVLMYIRDGKDYISRFFEVFNKRISMIDSNNSDEFNKLYKEVYEEVVRDLELP